MTDAVREGAILAGKYRVERVIGQGGMGVVVAARHLELEQLMAVKFLLPDILSDPEAVGRFLREGRAAARIRSEHVARVTDVGTLETGAPYMVMEYLEGSDLAATLRARGALPVEDALDYVAQACEAVAEAHALGIVHRDLKPSNLMLVRRSDGSECVKLLDFGISKVVATGPDAAAITRTRTAAVLGSPLYMSPEQIMSARDVDHRTDIWALGAITYELLTGKPAFYADTLPAIGVLIAMAQPVSMRTLRPEIPAEVEAIPLRCLQKSRDDRYANVAELAQALAPLAPARSQVPIERATRILGGAVRGGSGRPSGSKPEWAGFPLAGQPGQPGSLTPSGARHSGTLTAANSWIETPHRSARDEAARSQARERKRMFLLGCAALAVVAIGVTVTALVMRGAPRPADQAAAGGPPSAATAVAPEPRPTPAAPAPSPTPAGPPAALAAPEAPHTPDDVVPEPRASARAASAPVPAPARPAPRSPAPGAAPSPKKSAYDDM